MNNFLHPILASPDLSGLWWLDFYAGCVVPIYVLDAFNGRHIGLAIFQVAALLLVEILQWKLLKRAWLPLRLAGTVFVYFSTNIIFAVFYVYIMHGR